MSTVANGYDVRMNKRRVTVRLDEDLVDGLKAIDGHSMSELVNYAVRELVESRAHRRAAGRWIEELKQKHGSPAPEDYEWAREALDELRALRENGTGAA